MPTTFADEVAECQPAWTEIPPTPYLSNMYEGLLRSAGASAFRFNPSGYDGSVRWTDTSTAEPEQGDSRTRRNVRRIEVPFPEGVGDAVTTIAAGTTYDPSIPPEPVRSRVRLEPPSEETLMTEFRRSVRDYVQADRDSGFGTREYVVSQRNGELVKAAKAYEHLRPDLWPFGRERRFEALETNEWGRLVRAAAFLELEARRIGTTDTGAYNDTEREIKRLAFKAVDLRRPRIQEEVLADTYMEPF